jgi:tripartite-type tricarboxylate transporter receptor subunit TctC
MRAAFVAALAGSVCAHGAETHATYPNKPVRLIVSYPPGGTSDLVGRAVGQKLTETWRQQVVIDNRPGAGGIVGTELAAQSLPDGYTLLLGASSGLVLNPLLKRNLPYDTFRDFSPVSLLVVVPLLLVTNQSLPANSVKELIALAKKTPGKLNYASVGEGSPNHLGMELFKSMTGTDMVHVPYKSNNAAMPDFLAGQVQLMLNAIPSVLPHVKAGRLKALAVASAQRSQAVPTVPTVAEAGVPGFECVTWFALLAPAKTRRPIIGKLNTDVAKVLADREIVQRFVALGADARASTPEELTRFMRVETQRWGTVIKTAGIKAD